RPDPLDPRDLAGREVEDAQAVLRHLVRATPLAPRLIDRLLRRLDQEHDVTGIVAEPLGRRARHGVARGAGEILDAQLAVTVLADQRVERPTPVTGERLPADRVPDLVGVVVQDTLAGLPRGRGIGEEQGREDEERGAPQDRGHDRTPWLGWRAER